MAPLHPDQVIARAQVLFDQLRTLQIWEASLTSAAVPELTPLFVTSLDTAWPNYAIASIRDATGITARFAFDSTTGEFLEGEGVSIGGGHLAPYVAESAALHAFPPPLATPDIVWKPCRQSVTRFRPFWRFTVGGAVRYVRSDGEVFDWLTTDIRG